MNQRILAVILIFSAGAYSALAQAELMIEITKGVERASPIAIVPFAAQSTQVSEDMAEVISADLNRSGRFKAMGRNDMLATPSTPEQVRFPDWRMLGQDHLVIGQVRPGASGYIIQFNLFDVLKGSQLTSFTVESSAADLRRTAHRIADMIYQQLTGLPGAFATRIAYVTSVMGDNGKRLYRIQVADADGFAPQTIVTSPEPLMSPSWSADGKRRLAYVSFETKASAIYVQDLSTGKRDMVSSMPGINGAPAWSPDGRRLAVTLSKDGNPDVYVLELQGGGLTNISNNRAIDTEPNWSPDGGSIVFTSDRGGKPQLYIAPSSGGAAQRVTYEGDYNARGVFSPDGRSLAMVHGGGGFRIAVMDLKSRAMRVLTKGPLDESPSFAANGSMIMYASKAGNEGYLSAVSFDGGVHQRLSSETRDVREPAWSPF